jgi:hypothetical protein
MPLMWAHAEYIKLLRSTADGKVYDAIPEVAERYLGTRERNRGWKSGSPTGMFDSCTPAMYCACMEMRLSCSAGQRQLANRE